jgi:hypothetical protein
MKRSQGQAQALVQRPVQAQEVDQEPDQVQLLARVHHRHNTQ